jgi:hypothetical protein
MIAPMSKRFARLMGPPLHRCTIDQSLYQTIPDPRVRRQAGVTRQAADGRDGSKTTERARTLADLLPVCSKSRRSGVPVLHSRPRHGEWGQFEFKGLAGPFVVRGSCRDFKALVETSAHYCLTSQPYRNIATEIERDRPGSYADDFLMRYGRGPRLSRRHAGVRFVAWIS